MSVFGGAPHQGGWYFFLLLVLLLVLLVLFGNTSKKAAAQRDSQTNRKVTDIPSVTFAGVFRSNRHACGFGTHRVGYFGCRLLLGCLASSSCRLLLLLLLVLLLLLLLFSIVVFILCRCCVMCTVFSLLGRPSSQAKMR